jgi:hypothetical protein
MVLLYDRHCLQQLYGEVSAGLTLVDMSVYVACLF